VWQLGIEYENLSRPYQSIWSRRFEILTGPARSRSAPPKLVPLSNAFLAAIDPLGIPKRDRDPARFGAWVENACLSHAWNAGQQVRYWREEPLDVDGIVDGGWGKWAIEVKTGTISAFDLRGIAEFTRRHPDYRALVLCDSAQDAAVQRLGLDGCRGSTFCSAILAEAEPDDSTGQS